MWPYLAVGAMVAVAATIGTGRRVAYLPWVGAFFLLTLFVGLRHHVGMDWNNYLRMIARAEDARSLREAFQVAEPGYVFLLRMGAGSGYGIYLVNLISTAVAVAGVFAWAKRTPLPWLALLSSFPIYIMVVLMSANRQALAAGILMLAVAYWYRISLFWKISIVLLAGSFHTSSLIFLIFLGLDLEARPAIKIAFTIIFSFFMIYIIHLSGNIDYYDAAYGRGASELTQSSGALIHVTLNGLPALLWFIFRSKRQLLFPTPLMRNMAFAAIATVLLVPITSTAAGRLSLYWYPMSMWVWAALPQAFAPRFRRAARFGLSLAALAMAYGWLTFGNSSKAHIPYQNALMVPERRLEIGVVP